MKVLFTGEIFRLQRTGGVSRYFIELIKELHKMDKIDFRINTLVHKNQYLQQHSKSFRLRSLYLKHGHRGMAQLSNLLENFCLRIFPDRDIDVCHGTYFNPKLFSIPKCQKVITIYDMIGERFNQNPRANERKRRCFEIADHCIAISHSTKRDILQYYDAEPDKISVIHLASSLTRTNDPYSSWPAEFPASPFLLWIGGRAGYKNFGNFLKSFSRSRASAENVSVVCIGGGPFNPKELDFMRDQHISSTRIRQLEADDNQLVDLYSRAIGLVYPSAYEGFGIPPLEAMQYNCPVIASNTSSIPEVVGEAALLVNPESTAEIADAIDRLVFDSKLRNALIALGSDRWKEFSWSKCANETLSVYENL